jgi:hypothetical protein
MDSRRGKNEQFPFAELLLQSIYNQLAGYEDFNDAQMTLLGSDPPVERLGKGLGSGVALTFRD